MPQIDDSLQRAVREIDEFSLADPAIAANPYVADLLAPRHIDEMGRRIEAGAEHPVIQGNAAQVGVLAGFQGTDPVSQSKSLRAAEGGRAQGGMRSHGCRVTAGRLGQQGRVADLMEEIKPVVGCRTVGPQAKAYAFVQQGSDRRNAAGELHVGGRTMRQPGAGIGQRLAFGSIEMNRMDRNQPWTDDPESLQAC